jgi:hypothetical protein
VQVGDLISFKPKYMHEDDWSNPGIVLRQFDNQVYRMWIVWCEDKECIVDEDNYEVLYLTTSLQEGA